MPVWTATYSMRDASYRPSKFLIHLPLDLAWADVVGMAQEFALRLDPLLEGIFTEINLNISPSLPVGLRQRPSDHVDRRSRGNIKLGFGQTAPYLPIPVRTLAIPMWAENFTRQVPTPAGMRHKGRSEYVEMVDYVDDSTFEFGALETFLLHPELVDSRFRRIVDSRFFGALDWMEADKFYFRSMVQSLIEESELPF